MKLANLLRDSLKIHKVILGFVGLSLLIYFPAAAEEGTNAIIMISVGGTATLFLGCYIMFGAIFGIWVERWTITKSQVLRYFFKTGEKINSEHNHKREEILKWCNENTKGYVHVMPRNEIEQVFTTGHFFFKKKGDRLHFKMVWG